MTGASTYFDSFSVLAVNGPLDMIFFGVARQMDQKSNGQTPHTTTETMVNRPPPSFIYERLPFRAAAAPQSTSSADSADSFGGGAAVVGGSGAE